MKANLIIAAALAFGFSAAAVAAPTEHPVPEAGFQSQKSRAQVETEVAGRTIVRTGWVDANYTSKTPRSRAEVMAEQAREPKHYGDVNYLYFGD